MKTNFHVLIFPLFVGFWIFEGISSYERSSENLPNNVKTFAKFMDHLYEEYKKNVKMRTSSYKWNSEKLPKKVQTFGEFLDDLFREYKKNGKMGTSSYEWDSSNLAKNVKMFAKFMDDLYEEYKKNVKMDIHWLNQSKLYTEKGFSDKRKRTVFNLSFVKCAAEIAHFRVLNKNDDSKDAYLNLKVVTLHEILYAKNEFIGFLNFDQTLGQKIAKKFKDEIFSIEKQNPKVVCQILQLAFSFAVRVILSIIYAEYFNEKNDIGGWQLKTLLTAFKELSKLRGNTNDTHGIFPFKIIQIDQKNGEAVHFWAQKFLKEDENLKEGDSEQMIADKKDNLEESMIKQNFKFILELSDFTLSQYEISKVLQAIKNRPKKRQKFKAFLNKQNKNQPEIYKKMEHYFAKYLSSKNCAFLNFGRALAKRLKFKHEKFTKFAHDNKAKCGEDPHKVYDDRQKPFITDNNTPAKGSNQIEMELFNEPLWNYVRIIEIDANEAKAVVKFCEDLQKATRKPVKKLDENVFKIAPQVKNIAKLKEFKFLHSIIKLVEDKKNSDALEKFSTNYDGKKFRKKDLLTKLLLTLDEIHTDYSKTSQREISKNGIRLTHSAGNEISNFGQILYEILANLPEDPVKYDENEQLLTIPLSFTNRLLERLYKFIERNLKENSKISDDFDFVQTLQTVAEESTELKAEKRQKPILVDVNVKLFQLLFSLAIRLCFLIDEKEKKAEKYLPKFVFALKICSKETIYTNFELFEHKMKIVGKNVLINLRNWNLPYFVYKEKEDEFKMEKAEVEVNIRKLNELVKLVKPDYEKVIVNKIVQKLWVLLKLQEKKRKLEEDEAEVEMLREKLWMSY